MKSKYSVLFGALILLAGASAQSAQDYKIVPKSAADTGIRFDLAYTAGIHHGFSQNVAGDVIINVDPIEARSVTLKIPIDSMTTGDATRDCHMRESLGIDYTNSNFPKDHVCEKNKIPETGPNSVVYPNIELTILGVRSSDASPAPSLAVGKSATVSANVRLSIHGVSKDLVVPLTITSKDSKGTLQVTSNFPVLLADFKIIVKKFLFIKVADTANVKIDLNLVPK